VPELSASVFSTAIWTHQSAGRTQRNRPITSPVKSPSACSLTPQFPHPTTHDRRSPRYPNTDPGKLRGKTRGNGPHTGREPCSKSARLRSVSLGIRERISRRSGAARTSPGHAARSTPSGSYTVAGTEDIRDIFGLTKTIDLVV
jgi:hypothetical protein